MVAISSFFLSFSPDDGPPAPAAHLSLQPTPNRKRSTTAEIRWKRIIDRSDPSPLAVPARALLRIASWGYGAVVHARNRRYDKGNDVQRAAVPVICIGNLTTGGTGKTPVVCHIAARLRQMDVRVAIVSRGYKSDRSGSNDEARELYDRLPDVPHIQDPDRVTAAAIASEELLSQLILMDDGLQHRRLHRDANIILIDSSEPFGHHYLLPRGTLREPLAAMRRGDLVILTRTSCVEPAAIEAIKQTIESVAGNVPVLHSNHEPSHLRNHRGELSPTRQLQGERLLAISGIGNPSAFLQTVASCGGTVLDAYDAGDHAAFDRATMDQIRTWIQTTARERGAIDRIVCTHKDLVKLQTDSIAGIPLFAIQIELRLDDPDDRLGDLLGSMIQKIPLDSPTPDDELTTN